MSYWVQQTHLLDAFGEELSRPMERNDDPNGYRACQELSDRLRSAYVDGIRHRSALSPSGTNIALFDPSVMDIGPSKLVVVKYTRVSYYEPEDD